MNQASHSLTHSPLTSAAQLTGHVAHPDVVFGYVARLWIATGGNV